MTIGAYFLTGVLLWIKVIVKAVMLFMNSMALDEANVQRVNETATETINEGVEECGSMARLIGDRALYILAIIAAWPKYMQPYEEIMLSDIREKIEEFNRT